MGVHNRVSLQPGYVLHHRPYRDTSSLVEILTRDYGRIGVVARGAKRAKSRLYGVLQPFLPLIVSWSDKGDLGTLGSAEPQGPVRLPSGRTVMSGFYVNELLMRLLHRHDPHPLLFDEYSRVLQQLSILSGNDAKESTADFAEQRFLRIFEKNLLRELGYGLVLDHDVVTGKAISKDRYYEYFLDRGPVLRVDVSDSSKDRPDRRECISLSGHSLISLALDELKDDRSLLESKRLMRAVLKQYLGDKPLGSRRLFRSFVHASKIHNLDTTSM